MKWERSAVLGGMQQVLCSEASIEELVTVKAVLAVA